MPLAAQLTELTSLQKLASAQYSDQQSGVSLVTPPLCVAQLSTGGQSLHNAPLRQRNGCLTVSDVFIKSLTRLHLS